MIKIGRFCDVQIMAVLKQAGIGVPVSEFAVSMEGDVKDGDTVYVTRSDDSGLKISAHNPQVVAALEAAERVMDENRDLLQALA